MKTYGIGAALLLALLLFSSIANADPADGGGRHRMHPKLRARLLEKFDANHDGVLDDSERQAAREALQAKCAEKRQKVLEKFDADGDGTLSDEEKAAAKEAFAARLKQRFDRNGDGKLEGRERAAAKRCVRHLRRLRHRHRTSEGAPPTTSD